MNDDSLTGSNSSNSTGLNANSVSLNTLPSGTNKNVLYIVVGILVVVLFLGGLATGIYFIVRKKKKRNVVTQPPRVVTTQPPRVVTTQPPPKKKTLEEEIEEEEVEEPEPQYVQEQQDFRVDDDSDSLLQPVDSTPIIPIQINKKKPPPMPIASSKCLPVQTNTYDYTRRVKFGNGWKCPLSWQDTNCDWSIDGNTLGEFQCRRVKKKKQPPQPQQQQPPPKIAPPVKKPLLPQPPKKPPAKKPQPALKKPPPPAPKPVDVVALSLPSGPVAAPPDRMQLGIPAIPLTKGGTWNFSSVQKTEGRLTQVGDAFELVYPAQCGAQTSKCGSAAGMNGKASPSCCFPTTSVEFGYKVMFAPDFDFVNAGKLPGLWIGDSGASGGRWIPKGGSFRVMWRTDKGGINPHLVAYLYFPTEIGGSQQTAIVRQNIPGIKTTGKTGVDVWRKPKTGGAPFPIKRGEWIDVSLGLKLNTLGQSDGALTLTINGQKKTIGNLTWRESDLRINGIMFTSWFGGNEKEDYASSKDERAQFKDFWLKKA